MTLHRAKRLYRPRRDTNDYSILVNRPGGSRIAGYIPTYAMTWRICSYLNQTSSEHKTLQAIHAEMDGKVWSPDILDRIAEILRGSGYPI